MPFGWLHMIKVRSDVLFNTSMHSHPKMFGISFNKNVHLKLHLHMRALWCLV